MKEKDKDFYYCIYIDDLGNELLFKSMEDMLDYLKEVDYDEYKRISEEYYTRYDYDGKDIDTAMAEAIDELNNSL